MEKNKARKLLHNNPTWQVLSHLFQHPEHAVRGTVLSSALPHISKSAIYNVIHALKDAGVVIQDDTERYTLNHRNIWLRYAMIADSLMLLQPIVNEISEFSTKVILFGSRATGEYTSDSDFDLCVVSSHAKSVRQVIMKSSLAEKIQLLLKAPEEWIDLHRTGSEIYQSIKQGIILWDQK